ncbi:putative spermidine/putrescine transport system permease protein [Rhodoligotrophos appendicifer]|uniref:ABC transporter permease n=1 Tax=Rhodoligotrophos appendicifer TaxID=987056 RepID=UPI001478C13C|nr:ABC transporter permease [Rhodoligotrophos appendicifer]
MSGGTEHWWRRLRAVVCGLTIVYLVAPLIIVLIISFSSAPFLTFPPPGLSLQWYENLFNNPMWFGSLITSVKIMIPTAILATVLGTAASYALARSNFAGKFLVSGFVMAPMIVPVIIIAIGLFGVFRAIGLFGTLTGLIIAHTVLSIPYVFATVSGALSLVDRRLEDAASTLGAPPWTCFRRITLPLILPAILSGLLFAMVVSFDELVVSLFISSPTVRPVTVQMWSNIRGAVDPTIAAVATLLFCFSIFALIAESLARRRSDPSGR